uniref:Ion transport domain-containing protein n=1 Tax=Heterosigma akashiwo TaxID=2829 RepID=A0A7S3XWM2_HETAK
MGSLLNEIGAKRKKKGKKSTYRRPFFSSKWNYADSLIVLGQFLTTILVTAGWLAPGSAPALLFEALRPARLVPRIQQLKDLNQSVLASMTSITNLLNIILLLMFIYALAGMQLFKGMFYHCEDPAFPSAAPLEGVVDAGTGVWTAFPCRGNWTDPATNRTEYRDYEWGRPTFHFDSVFNSLLNVYVMSTLSGWLPVLFDAMDTTEFHYSPEVNHSPASFLYFFIGIFFFGFYFTNLFIGVVFQKFLGSKTVGEDGLLKSQEDRQWQDYKKRLEVVPLMKAHIRPANFPFNLIFDFVQSFLMRGVIFILLATNIIFVCIYLDPSGGEEKEAFLKKTNMAFFWIFLFVEVFRIASLGLFTYLDAKANQFIFFSVFISIVDVLFQASRPDVSYYYSTVTRLVLISTFVRLTRIIQFFSGIRVYRVAVLHHARILLTIVSMIGIGIFFYACLGVVLFEGVAFDPSMRYANFDSLGGAMQLLLSVATSDMWSEVFMATTLEDGATSEVLVILYFVSFVFVKLFILLNLFIMVICEIFELLENPERVEIELQIQAYREAWSKYDPLASGRLRGPADLWGLYYDLDKPLGAGPAPTLLYTKFRVDIMTQQPGFALGFHEVLVFMVALGGVPSSFSHLLEDAGLAVRTFGPIVLLQRCLRRYIRVFRRRKKERLSVKWEKAKRRISQGSVTMSSPRPQEQALGRRSSFNAGAGAGRRGSFQRRGSSTHLDNSRVSVRGSGSVKAAHAPLGENNWENWKKLSIFQH